MRLPVLVQVGPHVWVFFGLRVGYTMTVCVCGGVLCCLYAMNETFHDDLVTCSDPMGREWRGRREKRGEGTAVKLCLMLG